MNDLQSWLPTIITLGAIVLGAGKVMGKNDARDAENKSLTKRVGEVEDEQDDMRDRLTRLEAWRDGYNAALKAHKLVETI